DPRSGRLLRELIEAAERDRAALSFAHALGGPEGRVRVAALRRLIELPRRLGEVPRAEGRGPEGERILRLRVGRAGALRGARLRRLLGVPVEGDSTGDPRVR